MFPRAWPIPTLPGVGRWQVCCQNPTTTALLDSVSSNRVTDEAIDWLTASCTPPPLPSLASSSNEDASWLQQRASLSLKTYQATDITGHHQGIQVPVISMLLSNPLAPQDASHLASPLPLSEAPLFWFAICPPLGPSPASHKLKYPWLSGEGPDQGNSSPKRLLLPDGNLGSGRQIEEGHCPALLCSIQSSTFLVVQMVKNPPARAGDMGSIPG